MEQGLFGVLPKRAVTMTRSKMDAFMYEMGLDIQGRRGIAKLLAGAGHVITPNTIRIPVNDGLVFNYTWDKTLRMECTAWIFAH